MAKSRAILFCGDPHGRFDHIMQAAQLLKPMAVVLLGDLEPQRPLHVELGAIRDRVWFVHGNHDTASQAAFETVFDSDLAERNIHGRVVTLPDGIRLAGVGGVFRASVWSPPTSPIYNSAQTHAKHSPRQDQWRSGPARRHWASIYPDVVKRLASERADILITHEAPSCHPHGWGAIDNLARALGVSSAFHGHHHDSLDYRTQWPMLRFKAFGVGLRGVVDHEGKVIVPGELDDAHR
jgi:hypothetical protein